MNAAIKIVEKEKGQIAAVILEPLVQGAGGMKICRKEFLDKLVKMFKDQGILVIFDEVMTGFGRTGKMFATDHLTMKPDIICLAKSLTGGFIPLAATVFSEEIHKVFVDTNFNKTFLHGHSFSANPVACAAALSSLNLFNKDKTFKSLEHLKVIFDRIIKGSDKDNIVFSCGSGVTSCVLALAYSLINNNYNPTIYDGSWAEYGKIFK